MRGAWVIAAALVVGTAAGPARAGVYNTAEPWPQPRPFKQFAQELAGYRAAAVSKDPGSLGEHYERRAKELEADDARGMLSLEDRINLGAYYIRLGKYTEAIAVLEKAQGSRHFMLRANLATAYELAGVPDRALLYRQLALSSWPASYPGWDTLQINFYRKAEQEQLALLQLRQEEARQQPTRTGIQLDKLFPRVQFVGPTGQYEAGRIAPAQWCEIPNDAGGLVMQMLLWSPFDARLEWLLGELLNANGEVAAAEAMMNMVMAVGSAPGVPAPPGGKPQIGGPIKWEVAAPPELREHYRIVSEAAAARQKGTEAVMATNDHYFNLKLLCAVAPRGMGLGAGDLVGEAAWPAVVVASEPASPKASPAPVDGKTLSSAGWLPDWRTLAVGFAAGGLVVWLLGYQIRQARAAKG